MRRYLLVIFWPMAIAFGVVFFIMRDALSAIVFGLSVLVLLAVPVLREREKRRLLDPEPLDLPLAHLAATTTERSVTFTWDWVTPGEVRILRSSERYPQAPDDALEMRNGAECVYEGGETSFTDDGLTTMCDYRYTFFMLGQGAALPALHAWVTPKDADDDVIPYDTVEIEAPGGDWSTPWNAEVRDPAWNPEVPRWEIPRPAWAGGAFSMGGLWTIFAVLFVLPFVALAELIIAILVALLRGLGRDAARFQAARPLKRWEFRRPLRSLRRSQRP